MQVNFSVGLASNDSSLDQAILAYRQGQYHRAYTLLSQHDWQAQAKPQQARWLYYQAISAVQTGQLQQAEQLYAQLIDQFPGTEESRLSSQGLAQLAALANPGLDAPPLPQSGNSASQSISPSMTGAASSPEQLQFNQLVSLLGGGSPANGAGTTMPTFESLLLQSQSQPYGGSTSASGGRPMDPNVLSNLMMNQWLGQLDFTRNDKDRD